MRLLSLAATATGCALGTLVFWKHVGPDTPGSYTYVLVYGITCGGLAVFYVGMFAEWVHDRLTANG